MVLHLVAVAGQRPHDCGGGVVGAVAFDDGPCHDGTDAAFEFAGGFPAAMPDRLDDGEHVLRGDLADRHVAEARVGEPAEGGPPAVRGPPAVLPGRLVHRDHLLARLGEARRGGIAPHRRRVAALAGELAVLERGLAGLGEGGVRVAAEAEVAALASDGAPPDPLLGPRGGDAQDQAVLVAVLAGHRDGADERRGQLPHWLGVSPSRLSRCGNRTRILWDMIGSRTFVSPTCPTGLLAS